MSEIFWWRACGGAGSKRPSQLPIPSVTSRKCTTVLRHAGRCPLQQCEKYIFANDREIASDPAENVGYSYDRFRHIFVEVVGMGPKAYQQGIRMSNAKKLLTFTSKRVREIAAMCGYGNPVCFMNYFKNSMGISPSQYRKLSRSQARNKTFNFKAEE
ncbi:MAG: helix-turn-helix domain-containing protein [Eubacteriales bacterium]